MTALRDSDLLRRIFETVLQHCIDEGWVGGEGFAIFDGIGHLRSIGTRQRGAGCGRSGTAEGPGPQKGLIQITDEVTSCPDRVPPAPHRRS